MRIKSFGLHPFPKGWKGLKVWVFLTVLCLALASMTVCAPGCESRKVYGGGGEGRMAGKTIESVLEEHTEELMALPGVVGTAEGSCGGRPCIKVFVTKRTPELDKKIPAALDGYPVEVEETGGIKAMPGGK
jgi:hypothetical protein